MSELGYKTNVLRAFSLSDKFGGIILNRSSTDGSVWEFNDNNAAGRRVAFDRTFDFRIPTTGNEGFRIVIDDPDNAGTDLFLNVKGSTSQSNTDLVTIEWVDYLFGRIKFSEALDTTQDIFTTEALATPGIGVRDLSGVMTLTVRPSVQALANADNPTPEEIADAPNNFILEFDDVGGANEYNANFEADVLDDTEFGNPGFRSKILGIKDMTATMSRWTTPNDSALDYFRLLIEDSPGNETMIEIRPGGGNAPHLRAYVVLSNDSRSGDIGSLEQEDLNWELSFQSLIRPNDRANISWSDI